MCSVRFRRVHRVCRRNNFCLMSKPFQLNLRFLAQRIHGFGEMNGVTFAWPWPKIMDTESISKKLFSARLIEHHSSEYYNAWQPDCYSQDHYLIRFWRSSLENCDFGKFSFKISDVFIQGQHNFWPYLRNGWADWCETKRKCIGWILGIPYDLARWPLTWPWP